MSDWNGGDGIEPPDYDDKLPMEDYLDLGEADREQWERVWDEMPGGLSESQTQAVVDGVFAEIEYLDDDFDWDEFFEEFADFWDWWEEWADTGSVSQ